MSPNVVRDARPLPKRRRLNPTAPLHSKITIAENSSAPAPKNAPAICASCHRATGVLRALLFCTRYARRRLFPRLNSNIHVFFQVAPRRCARCALAHVPPVQCRRPGIYPVSCPRCPRRRYRPDVLRLHSTRPTPTPPMHPDLTRR
jgi:hypothetical protein